MNSTFQSWPTRIGLIVPEVKKDFVDNAIYLTNTSADKAPCKYPSNYSAAEKSAY